MSLTSVYLLILGCWSWSWNWLIDDGRSPDYWWVGMVGISGILCGWNGIADNLQRIWIYLDDGIGSTSAVQLSTAVWYSHPYSNSHSNHVAIAIQNTSSIIQHPSTEFHHVHHQQFRILGDVYDPYDQPSIHNVDLIHVTMIIWTMMDELSIYITSLILTGWLFDG